MTEMKRPKHFPKMTDAEFELLNIRATAQAWKYAEIVDLAPGETLALVTTRAFPNMHVDGRAWDRDRGPLLHRLTIPAGIEVLIQRMSKLPYFEEPSPDQKLKPFLAVRIGCYADVAGDDGVYVRHPSTTKSGAGMTRHVENLYGALLLDGEPRLLGRVSSEAYANASHDAWDAAMQSKYGFHPNDRALTLSGLVSDGLLSPTDAEVLIERYKAFCDERVKRQAEESDAEGS